MENLKDYLEGKNKDKTKDSYSMSVRELKSMYETGLINLSPVYQRKFRWDNIKASKLIESIFMGIPLPPIFISVREGKWDIIDGVQRISSILWFLGELKEGDSFRSPLILQGLEELEELNENTFASLRKKDLASVFKYFEMKRLDLVLLTSDDIESEYNLFSRLNTGGIKLSAQEIRNFLIVKLNPELYEQLLFLQTNKLVTKILSISPKQIAEDYGMELLVYFIIVSKAETIFKHDSEKRKGLDIYKSYKSKFSLSRDRFIDKCISIILKENIDIAKESEKITTVFEKINSELGNSPFKKSSKFSPFLYICLISYACNSKSHSLSYDKALEKIQQNNIYVKKAYRGTNVVDQFLTGIEIGRDLLNE